MAVVVLMAVQAEALLLAMEEKRVEIEVGYGLEGVLPDALCGRILDTYAVPSFKKGEFGAGVLETARAISKVIAKEEVPLAAAPAESKEVSPYFLVLIIAVIILGAILRKPGSIFMGVFGAIWGAAWGGIVGAVLGALVGFFFGFWGLYFSGRGMGGGFGRGGFGGSGGFGGGRSGGGGAGRGW